LENDIGLIEASFAAQYSIRLRKEHGISVAEFSSLLAGLLPETPLGVVIGIRGERDMKRVMKFSKAERRIYDEWKGFVQRRKQNVRDAKMGLACGPGEEELQRMLERMFG